MNAHHPVPRGVLEALGHLPRRTDRTAGHHLRHLRLSDAIHSLDLVLPAHFADPRVVHEDVESSVSGEDGLEHAPHLARIRDVGRRGQRSRARFAHRPDRSADRLLVKVVHGHARPFPGEN
jgi:hypothetical protein